MRSRTGTSRGAHKGRPNALCACAIPALLLAITGVLSAQYARPKITNGVTIEQRLNQPIPLDLVFHDEANQRVPLWKYFRDKPVVLSLVYFNCPSLCPMSLHETVTSLRRVSLEPGRDYNVVVVSFDPRDTPREAELTKVKYKAHFGNRAGYDAGWHFLTGDQQSILKLADSLGFHFRWDDKSKQFVHAGGIMVATPDGKLSRYFYGIDYAPADLRMALVDASQHKIGSPVDYVLLFCFHYDAAQGKYTLAIVNVLKIAGGFTLAILGALIYYLIRDEKNKKTRTVWKEAQHVG
ncbi:MAG: SCO family protein [Acidobacteriaceae bacterium]|nr:SCO family protein [Acidobacteriaceae bacterium]